MSAPPRILALLTLVLLGLSATGRAEDWKGSCEVTFSGKSTLHDFEGTVSAKPFVVSLDQLEHPAQAHASSRVVVEAAKMDTDNDERDEKMHECMDVKTFPEIVVEVTDLAAADTKPVTGGAVPQPTVIPFVLDLKGKKQKVTGKVSDWKYDGDSISCTVTFPVSLKASNIKPPSVLGIVKVKDEIEVAAHLELKRN